MSSNLNKIEVVVDASRAPPPAPVKALSERIAYVPPATGILVALADPVQVNPRLSQNPLLPPRLRPALLLLVVDAAVDVPVIVVVMLVVQRQRLLKSWMRRWWTITTPARQTILLLESMRVA